MMRLTTKNIAQISKYVNNHLHGMRSKKYIAERVDEAGNMSFNLLELDDDHDLYDHCTPLRPVSFNWVDNRALIELWLYRVSFELDSIVDVHLYKSDKVFLVSNKPIDNSEVFQAETIARAQ